MKKPLAILLLVGAFLLSGWSNVIAASSCPAYLARNCCVNREAQQTQPVVHKSCHHEMSGMSDMKMDDMQMDEDYAQAPEVTSMPETLATVPPTESLVEQAAFALPDGPCGHCWMHSQPSSGPGTLAPLNSSSRSGEVSAPSAGATVYAGSRTSNANEALEHGPPGMPFPRHVLIKVFRI